MAATTLGTSGLSFGITAESGGLVQSFTETRNVQRAEARNGSGEVVALSLYNPTKSYSYTFLTTSSMSTTAGATLASIANASDVTGKVVVDSVSISKTTDGYQTASINATQFPNVS
jgi:hypothetical protein